MKKTINILILLVSCFIYANNSYSSCQATGSTNVGSLNLGNLVVQRDAPVGTVLATVNSSYTNQQVDMCTGGGYENYYITYPGASTTGISNVYSTNIPGIGIRGKMFGIYASPAGVSNYIYGNSAGIFSGPATLEVVKTGTTSSGTFITGEAMKVTVDNGAKIESIVITGGSVTSLACSVSTPNVNVALDPVLSSSFTGVNSTKGPQPFTIGLSCSASARINASLSFTQNTDTSDSSVIQLTGAGTQGSATGVGIQLLYGSTILKNNTNVVLKTSSGGSEFPTGAFTARYFQTRSTVTTGDANATATLNLTYQ